MARHTSIKATMRYFHNIDRTNSRAEQKESDSGLLGPQPAVSAGLCLFCPEVPPAGKATIAFRPRVLLEPLLLSPIGKAVVLGVGEVVPYVQEPTQAAFAIAVGRTDISAHQQAGFHACC